MPSTLLPIAALQKTELHPEDFVVFGGTFDPIHEGHLGAVASLLEKFATVVIAPTTANPWKDEHPSPLDLRTKMIETALKTFLPKNDWARIHIDKKGYQFAVEVVERFRANHSGTLYWAVGEDIAEETSQWKEWPQLEVPTVVVPIVPNIHATDIRSGKEAILPSLESFVREFGLYGHIKK